MIWIYIISGLLTAVLCHISFRIGLKTGVKEIVELLKQNCYDSSEIKDKEGK